MKLGRMSSILLFVAVVLAAFTQIGAQTADKPVFAGYKGVNIGMSMSDARTKLGTPRDKSDAEDYYVYSDSESVQVVYDTDKTVRVISINYLGKDDAPKPIDVFGTSVEAKPDGSISKMVKYPKAGYWISYLKTGGDQPLVMITVQKMRASDQ